MRFIITAIAYLAFAAGLAITPAAAASSASDPPVRISIYFQLGDSSLTSEAEAVLDEVVKAVHEGKPARVIIVGHTDKSGSVEVNRRIAAERAAVVRQGLIDRGLDPGAISVLSAESQPSAGESPDFISERRTDVVIVPDSGGTGS